MKITEIIDTEFRDTKHGTEHNNTLVPNNALGSGAYSYVVQDDDSPFEVDKFNADSFPNTPDKHESLSKDPYFEWIKAIAPYVKSNPYLPRVYVADLNSDTNGAIKPSFKMEKLHDPQHVEFNVLVALYQKETDGDSDFLEYVNDLYDSGHDKKATFVIWDKIVQSVAFNSLWNDNIEQVNDIITNLTSIRGFKIDNHDGNFMIRLTSIGPQIVFTDPIS